MKLVTLSFDNGPDPSVTPRVLDVLARKRIVAHFFVLGKRLADPDCRRLVSRARDEGHFIGNHSFSHAVPLGEDARADSVEAEIAATEGLLAPLVPGPKRFRPFGGAGLLGPHLLNRRAVDYLVQNAYSCVLWNSVPRDWVDPEGWPARALAQCTAGSHTLVVLHDIADACLRHLEAFIDASRREGLMFVPDLPRECTPIVDGKVVGDLRGIVAAEV